MGIIPSQLSSLCRNAPLQALYVYRLDLWSAEVELGQKYNVEYRFFKANDATENESILPGGNVIVTEWETNLAPRNFKQTGKFHLVSSCFDAKSWL